MAQVFQNWRLTVNMVGDSLAKRSKVFELDTAIADETAAEAAATAIMTRLGLMTGAFVTGYTLSKVYQNDTALVPPAGVYMSLQASFSVVDSVDPTKFHRVVVPGILDSLILEGSNDVDVTDAAVINFLNIYQPQASGGYCTLSDGENVKTVSGAAEIKSAKRITGRGTP